MSDELEWVFFVILSSLVEYDYNKYFRKVGTGVFEAISRNSLVPCDLGDWGQEMALEEINVSTFFSMLISAMYF